MKKHYSYFPYFGAAGELTPTEEEASSWLLALPHLLDWPHEIYWLWPELDQRNYVARLWGVDSTGTLIIVEIRRDRGDAPDPYEGFVFEIKSRWMDRDWTTEVLLENWRKYWKGQPCAPANARSVVKALKRRAKVGNPHPVLIGVIASTQADFRLSAKARKSFEQLQKRVGDERVRLSVISGTFGDRGLRVQCTTFDDSDQVVPSRKPCANAQPGRRRSRRSPCLKQSPGWRYGLRFVVQG
ncbi:MAG TPA: hypothetical protein VHH35_17525 [Pyrinomonadaceae bacterium]|nr:hypothetical protein [Pyrinomonadaceae bacterium]